MRALFTAILFAVVMAAPAHAHHSQHHRHRHVAHHVDLAAPRGDPMPPHQWCGWFMRQVHGVANKAYNVARNWARFGTDAGGPHDGAVIVWPHHVGDIVAGSCPAGMVMVHSGNDGNTVRTRCRSYGGAIAFRNPPGTFGG